MFGKRKFNELFDEFDSFFNEIKPTYYKVGPNGYIFYYIRVQPEGAQPKNGEYEF